MNNRPIRPPAHVSLTTGTIEDVQKLFDALIEFMGVRWTQTNIYANKETSSGATNCGINCTDAAGNSFNYSERIVGPRVTISPAGANLGPGEVQQFTATVTDETGTPIDGAVIAWSVNAGPNGGGSIDTIRGKYTAPATIAAAGSDSVVALYPEAGSSAQISVALHP